MASGFKGIVLSELPVVGCADTLRTNSKLLEIYFHTGMINDAKYANILSRLSAAKHLCFVSVRANVSFEWGMSVHTHTHR